MDNAEERALVRKLARMDEGAWEAFCGEFSPLLLGFVRFCLSLGREEAEEVVQMTFLRCVRSIGTFDPERGRLFGWLKAVARNEAHTFVRKNREHRAQAAASSLPDDVARRILEKVDDAPLPDELLARQDVRSMVQDVLAGLNSRYHRALVLKYVDGLKAAEIAAMQGVSEKAVESLLVRSRQAFRQAFLRKVRRPGQRDDGAIL